MATKATTSTEDKKTTKTRATRSTAPDINLEEIQAENSKMKQELEVMSQQLERLMGMVNNTLEPVSSTSIEDETDVVIISLVQGTLNLCDKYGTPLCVFSEIYEEQEIPFSELREIVQANRKMVENGRFYIMNAEVVRKLRLQRFYERLLSPDDLKTLLKKDINHALELYKSASHVQQQVIIDIITDKIFKHQKIDANLLQELSQLCGKDLMNIENPLEIPIDTK